MCELVHIFTYSHTCARMYLPVYMYVGMIVFYPAFVSSQICSVVYNVDVFPFVQIIFKQALAISQMYTVCIFSFLDKVISLFKGS